MKTALIIIILLLLAVLVAFIALGILSKSGSAVGIVNGSLAKCPNKPNCVCSEQDTKKQHAIEPITFSHNITSDPLSILKNAVREMGGTIHIEDDQYFAATFSSNLFGFVDDLEIRIDPNKAVIHLRSASRVGYSDRGVNKKRIEILRDLYEKDQIRK